MSVCACGLTTNNGRPICERCAALAAFGLTREATPAEIRDAYLTLAKVWHPDRFHDDEQLRPKAEEKLKEINSAYRLLTTTSAEVPSSGRPTPAAQPEASQQAQQADAGAGQTRSSAARFDGASSRTRHTNRMWFAVAFVIVFAAGAWLILRDSAAPEFGTLRPPNSSSPHATAAASPVKVMSEGADSPTGPSVQAKDAAKPAEQATRPRRTTVAAQGASLLVYPADDPRVPYFTIGSTKEDVIRVQGKPSTTASDTFEYGPSEVYFQNGRVQSWRSDPSSPLRARAPE